MDFLIVNFWESVIEMLNIGVRFDQGVPPEFIPGPSRVNKALLIFFF